MLWLDHLYVCRPMIRNDKFTSVILTKNLYLMRKLYRID